MKYVIDVEARKRISDGATVNTLRTPAGYYIAEVPVEILQHAQELDSDYINQNFSYMQDESFRAGFELCRRICILPLNYEKAYGDSTLETIFGSPDCVEITGMDPLEVEKRIDEYEAEKAREKAEKAKEAAKAKEAQEALDKAAAKAVEAFRKLGANYVQIAQAVTKAMAEAVEAEA